jgi:hypothetical protein
VGKESFNEPFSFSNTIQLNCSFNGKPICCALKNEESPFFPRQESRFIGSSPECEYTRRYISSPYEISHLEKINQVNPITDEKARRREYLDFIFQDIPNTVRWLERVKVHMGHSEHVDPTEEDYQYLSRFEVTKSCKATNKFDFEKWNEWIEPITIYGRHPYGIIRCAAQELLEKEGFIHYKGEKARIPFQVSKESRDHILLQNYQSFAKGFSSLSLFTGHKRYLFDLGTRTFQSSLQWFICGYLQRGMDFDHIYAFEVQNISAVDYWAQVPHRIHPFLHFYNIPVQSSHKQPLGSEEFTIEKFLRVLVKPQDFVSVKLDIDRSSIEMPIVLNILRRDKRSGFRHLIDEFFFELHFRCEFMMYCGWGGGVPRMVEGFELDRKHATDLFLNLRKAGVRAHIWP